ncbi:MAG: phytanoyl-CoA dioxygenase family protein [Planctomycetales bacterium]
MESMFTASEVESYRKDGCVVARAVLDAEDVALLHAEALAMWDRCGQGENAQNTNFFGVKKMSTVRDPQLHSGVFSRFLTDPRLTDRMAELVGPTVQLHHSKINIKTRSDRAVFPLHQDHPYFPHERHSVCTVLIHLTTTDSDRGCFRVIPGVKEPLEHVADDGHILDPEKHPLESAIETPAAAGDVVFMNYLTPHGSNLNTTDEPRILWIIQVRAAEDRPVPQSQGVDQPTAAGNRPSQGAMLRGVNPDFAWAAEGKSSEL